MQTDYCGDCHRFLEGRTFVLCYACHGTVCEDCWRMQIVNGPVLYYCRWHDPNGVPEEKPGFWKRLKGLVSRK